MFMCFFFWGVDCFSVFILILFCSMFLLVTFSMVCCFLFVFGGVTVYQEAIDETRGTRYSKTKCLKLLGCPSVNTILQLLMLCL